MEDQLHALRDVVAHYAGHALTEQDTKNAIIEPVLALFGWPKTDLSRVRAEYRHTSRDNPVDYALIHNGRPVLLVEAKALDKSIDEHKFITQNLSYANAASVEWALLTNGHRWDLYAVFDRGAPEKRRVFSTTIEDPDFAASLHWIQPHILTAKELEQHWRRSRSRRAVKAALTTLLETRDDELVKLLASRSHATADEVRAALDVLRPTFLEPGAAPATPEPPTSTPEPTVPTSAPSGRGLSPPLAGTKPTQLHFGAFSRNVNSWRELLVAAAELAHEKDPTRFQTVFTADDFVGRKRRFFDTHPEAMLSPLAIPGGFVEGNQSASAIVKLVARLVDYMGIQENTVAYDVQDAK